MATEVVDFIRQARLKSVPFICVNSPDQNATLQQIKEAFAVPNGKQHEFISGPIITWDILRGFYALNYTNTDHDPSDSVISQMNPKPESFAGAPHRAIAACGDLKFMPALSYVFIVNAHRVIDNPSVIQAIMNVRTHFTKNQKQLILLCPSMEFPPEIAQDFRIIDEELPTPEEHKALITKLCTANKIEVPDLDRAASALKGLHLFGAEQVVAMSGAKIDGKRGIDLKKLWSHKKSVIENTPGLKMIDWNDITFDKVGGLQAIKTFFSRLFAGPRAPKVIVKVDEIEKMFGGLSGAGDNTGITQDMLGFLLKFMENHKHTGCLNIGPAGTGKTHMASAIASTFKVPFLEAEFGETINSKAGESQQRFKAMLGTIQAIAGDGGCCFFATCNKLNILPPELKRRFRLGTFFYDLPCEEERLSIASIQAKSYGLDEKEASKFFSKLDGVSGANIRDTMELAVSLQCSLKDAFTMVVPAEVQDREGISELRRTASNRFLSAAYPGVYQAAKNTDDTAVRKIEL